MTVVDITNARGDVVCVSDIVSHTHTRKHDEVAAAAGATYCRSHNPFFPALFSPFCFGVYWVCNFDRIVSARCGIASAGRRMC